jgi:hypothetical protein
LIEAAAFELVVERGDVAGSRQRREDRDDRRVPGVHARRARVQVLRVQQDGSQQKRRAGIADAQTPRVGILAGF